MASEFVISAAAMIFGILRYDSELGGGPIQTASSAKRTCKLSASAFEYTATVLMPISLHVRITRSAISPLLAMRIFLNIIGALRRLFTMTDQQERAAGRIQQAKNRRREP